MMNRKDGAKIINIEIKKPLGVLELNVLVSVIENQEKNVLLVDLSYNDRQPYIEIGRLYDS